jgi:hypothetical protein
VEVNGPPQVPYSVHQTFDRPRQRQDHPRAAEEGAMPSVEIISYEPM